MRFDENKGYIFASTTKHNDMKKQIVILTIGLLATAASTSALAQKQQRKSQAPQAVQAPVRSDSTNIQTQPSSHGEMQGEHFRMMNLPNLTDTQKAEIRTIHSNFITEREAFAKQAKELKARKAILLTEGNEVTPELIKVITDLNTVRTNLEISKAKEDMSIKAKLTPEQKIIFNKRIQGQCDRKDREQYKMQNKAKYEKAKKDAQVKTDNTDSEEDEVLK